MDMERENEVFYLQASFPLLFQIKIILLIFYYFSFQIFRLIFSSFVLLSSFSSSNHSASPKMTGRVRTLLMVWHRPSKMVVPTMTLNKHHIGDTQYLLHLSHTGDCLHSCTTFSPQVQVADKLGAARAEMLSPILKGVSRAQLWFDGVLGNLQAGFQDFGTGFLCSHPNQHP